MALRPLSGANVTGLQKSKPLPFGANARGYADVYDFTTGTTITRDYQVKDLALNLVQSLYIDNSNNSQYVTINVNGVDFSCQAYATCVLPFLVGDSGLHFVAFSNGNVAISIMLINVILPAFTAPSYSQGSLNLASLITIQNPVNMPVPIHNTDQFNYVSAYGGSFEVTARNAPLPVVPYQGYIPVTAYGGSLAVTALGGSFAVTGQFFQPTQPVSVAATLNVNITNASLPTLAQPTGNIGAQATLLGATAAATVKAGAGRLWGFAVTVAGTASGTLSDGATGVIAPISATIGIVMFPGGIPFSNGLMLAPGAGQTISVFYS